MGDGPKGTSFDEESLFVECFGRLKDAALGAEHHCIGEALFNELETEDTIVNTFK